MEHPIFFEQCPIGVCIIRRDRRKLDVLYVNPVLSDMLYLPAYAGMTLEDIWPGEDVAALAKSLKSMKPIRESLLPIASNHEYIEPHTRWASLTIQEADYEKKNCFILWVTDISASKETEARLQKDFDMADASAKMKANFLATMSHEIRTPMQSVYGLLELIGEEKPDERIKAMVDTAKNSASGLLEILNDILDFAKMDTANMELDMFEVPVRTLVRGTNEAMAVKIHGHKVKLIDDIAKDVPFVVIGDPKRLRQILMNLTGNALKFTKQGTVTIRVTKGGQAVQPLKNGLVLRFEVIDSGIGMSADVCNKLFQPFVQADSSTSRKYGGTGLGLSICRKLVEIMGGQIGVTSIEGTGSTFWFEIPTEEVSTQATAIDLPKLDGISVLSVEDHPQGAKEIVRSLESMGARVESCPTIKEAMDLVRRRPFDVSVIDQGLPDGLGIDLIRDVMKVRPFMGLIMYTVRDDLGLQHTLNSLGVTYLSKPASRRGLGEAVKDAVRKNVRIAIDGPTRLLIAEDTASVRDVLQRQLDKLGVSADFVSDGAQVLEVLKTGKYGILFSDLHMPEIDGYEVIDRIRKAEAATPDVHFPVIVLTADVQMAQRQTYMSYGFDECLLKPVSLGQLRGLLIRWGLLSETADIPEEAAPAAPATDQEPAIDVAKVREQMGALDAGSIEMLNMFIDMTQSLITSLRHNLEKQNYNQLKEDAHSLKGGARSACCNVLGDIAAQLQEDAADKKSSCAGLVGAAEKEFARAAAAIRNLKTD